MMTKSSKRCRKISPSGSLQVLHTKGAHGSSETVYLGHHGVEQFLGFFKAQHLQHVSLVVLVQAQMAPLERVAGIQLVLGDIPAPLEDR
jgi:hypothetical protein